MNDQAKKMLSIFYNDVWNYIETEYHPKWAKIYNDESILDDMLQLTSEYFFGGNTVPFTAGQIVDLLKSKYGRKS